MAHDSEAAAVGGERPLRAGVGGTCPPEPNSEVCQRPGGVYWVVW